ncbi:MAG: phosphoglycerate kinase [Pirellulales bacterium]|nr:phosphoglycerate kinase [Pirellulales bacterium]
MKITADQMQSWCQTLLAGKAAAPDLTLCDYLDAIPKLDSLADLPEGTAVLVRGDVDAKPGEKIGDGDIRLRSMVETLQFGRDHGWKQIIFGHIGRDPKESLVKVAERFAALLETDVPLLTDWLDEESITIADAAVQRIADSKPGSLFVLENTRQYKIERVLWKAKPADLPSLAEPLAGLANQFYDKIATVFVNEAFSAGSLDASSTVVPAVMDRVALGRYVADQFMGPMMQCLKTQLVVFSGLKIDKLDDLEAMVGRGTIRRVLAAGSLAMALKKAIAELDGKACCLGVAEDLAHSDQPYYIPRERVDQAKRMITAGRKKGVRFTVPIDSVIQDGSIVSTLRPTDQQFDIGPESSKLFEQEVGQFIESRSGEAVAFHNGVFGKFEDPQFEEGTRRFFPQLKRMKDAGIEVYVGGGEGGKGLKKYGKPDWVTHVFTAGGTVLNALGSEPVPYLVALRTASLPD